ncbi:hypothetical protein OIU85_002641 [Salix viminalis]|uniref:Aminotransferase-like plant mobile domain-containing protein n=1 Tax=Salix viminalis TaxID=40686 RepID=A0A9Q0VNS9_SALVM|nr:hypothetical protein OIU85_002641 [Salix viminalis]
MVGLLEYWCPETNTFVFPWGDIVNLAGPSVLGELVTEPLAGDSVNIEEEMSQHRKEMCQTKLKKARHGSVLDNWHHSSYYREEDEQGSWWDWIAKDSYLPHRVAMQFGNGSGSSWLIRNGASEKILKQEISLEKTDPSPSVQTIRQKNSYLLSSAQNLKNCRKLTQLASKSVFVSTNTPAYELDEEEEEEEEEELGLYCCCYDEGIEKCR